MGKEVKLLKKESYQSLIAKLLEHRQVYAPVDSVGRVMYRRITSAGEVAQEYILPDMSAKAFVFPRIEKLFGYSKGEDGEVSIYDVDLEAIPHKVVLGVRPCDARGMEGLGAIFGWDPADPIFQKRVERTAFIGMACEKSDDRCFCTSLGGGPGDVRGSDILLTRGKNGDYIAEILTPKGEEIVAMASELFESEAEGVADKTKYLADVPVRFDDSQLEQKMGEAFDTELFDELALRCIGCGACAFVCPTCACFDIQDEAKGSKGERMRSWDTCGSKLFTLHTSGHNPRENQGARWRQRLMHKFSYMPERLDVRGCVGCGRCSRKCPVDMNITESLLKITTI